MTPADDAFVAFAHATSSRLLRTAWLTCGDAQLAEDLVQGALAAVYQRWGRLQSGDPAAYARRCIVNAHIDATRRRRHEVVTELVPDRGAVDALPPDTRWLLTALATLPQRERQCVVLRHYADVPEAEVADLLGVSLGTVKSSTSRGLMRLRALLAEGDTHVR